MVSKSKKQVRISEIETYINQSQPKQRTYPYNGYLVHPEDYGLELEHPKPIQQEDVALSHSEEQRLREESRLEKQLQSEVSELKKNNLLDHRYYNRYAHEREHSFHHLADRSHHYHQLARVNRYSSRKALLDYHMDHLLNIYGIYMPEFTGGQDPELELYLQRLRTPSWVLPEATEISSHHHGQAASSQSSKQISSAAASSQSSKQISSAAASTESSKQVSSLNASSSSASSKSLSRFMSSTDNYYRTYKLHKTQFRRAEYGHRY